MTAKDSGKVATFSDSVDAFLHVADWLTDEHLPSVVALRGLARELDREVTAALIAQFGVLHRSLLKARPVDAPVVDPFTALLQTR